MLFDIYFSKKSAILLFVITFLPLMFSQQIRPGNVHARFLLRQAVSKFFKFCSYIAKRLH